MKLRVYVQYKVIGLVIIVLLFWGCAKKQPDLPVPQTAKIEFVVLPTIDGSKFTPGVVYREKKTGRAWTVRHLQLLLTNMALTGQNGSILNLKPLHTFEVGSGGNQMRQSTTSHGEGVFLEFSVPSGKYSKGGFVVGTTASAPHPSLGYYPAQFARTGGGLSTLHFQGLMDSNGDNIVDTPFSYYTALELSGESLSFSKTDLNLPNGSETRLIAELDLNRLLYAETPLDPLITPTVPPNYSNNDTLAIKLSKNLRKSVFFKVE